VFKAFNFFNLTDKNPRLDKVVPFDRFACAYELKNDLTYIEKYMAF